VHDPNEVDWWSIALQSTNHRCEDNLEFSGHLAAPGKGQAWDCRICGESFHRINADAPAVRFADLHPSTFELQPWEVI